MLKKPNLEMFDLSNKNIVISGGLGRIALPMTIALLEKHSNLFVLTKNPSKHKNVVNELKKKFPKFNLIKCDVSKINSIKTAIKKIKLIPNVFIHSSVIRPVHNNKTENLNKWKLSVTDNATSLHLTCSMFSEIMKKNYGGSIIIVSSIYGIRAPDQNLYTGTKMSTESDYPFLKGGSIIYSNYMASKMGKYNIRFNVIAPGGLDDHFAEPKFKKRYIKKVPLGRMLKADDLKGIAVFLSADESSYITGCTIKVDGGICL